MAIGNIRFLVMLRLKRRLSWILVRLLLVVVGAVGARHGARVPQQLQELDAGADGHPLGRIGGGPCPYPGQLYGTGIRQVRSVRAPPGTDAAVGGVSYRLSSREVEPRVQVIKAISRLRWAGQNHRRPPAVTPPRP